MMKVHPTGRAFAQLLSVLLLFGANTASAQGLEDRAKDVCRAEMTGERAASNLRDMKVRWRNQIPFVYGAADFDDIKNVKFFCQINKNTVGMVRYLVRAPRAASGRAWVAARPQGSQTEELELDAAATTPPPADVPDPKFITVPQSDGQDGLDTDSTATTPSNKDSTGAHFIRVPESD
ncbi:MAG: hypothetical protein ABNH23_01860 [Tateyamaria sp.]|jgi:hypothetical protein|uniref:hypothetical protein n=2 Tax=Tateyamaria sp. TaxID=1929288 RepID=UPI0032DC91B0